MSSDRHQDLPLRERKKRKAHRDIVRAARVLIDRNGYQQTKMRDIASAADLSYQTLYNYFPTKASILEAILSTELDDLSTTIAMRIDAYDGGLLATLAAVNRLRLQTLGAEDQRELWWFVATEVWNKRKTGTEMMSMADQAASEMITRLLHRSQRSGDLVASVDVGLLADTLNALAECCISRFLYEPGRALDTTLADLDAQMRLLLTPYLTGKPGTN